MRDVPRSTAKTPGGEAGPDLSSDSAETLPELEAVAGRVKWFDATRGFGFIVSDDLEGDILLHFSVLREHGRRSVPEGTTIECVPVRLDRGLQAKKVLSIDLSSALPQQTHSSIPAAERADRRAEDQVAGEAVEAAIPAERPELGEGAGA